MPTARDSREHAIVDQIALVYESAGLSPVAGRIVGRLVVCWPPEQSSAELSRYCHASKGAISTATRQLMHIGLIEKARQRGSRQHFFRICDNAWTHGLHAKILILRNLQELGVAGLELFADAEPEQRKRLQDFHDVNAFFARELPALIDRWDRLKASKEKP